MIDPQHLDTWITRERQQGQHLVKGLLDQRYERRLFRSPQTQIRSLSRSQASALSVGNPHARITWFSTFADVVCRHLGAVAPDFVPRQPAYLLTLIDAQQAFTGSTEPDHDATPFSLRRCRHAYAQHLVGLDCLGMLEPAYFVYLPQRDFADRRLFVWHLHALVWNTTRATLDRRCKHIRKSLSSLVPRVTPADVTEIQPADLLQLIWYLNKAPRSQYSLSIRHNSNGLKQYATAISGVNAVRVHHHMNELYLDHLLLDAGEGSGLAAEIKHRALTPWRDAVRIEAARHSRSRFAFRQAA